MDHNDSILADEISKKSYKKRNLQKAYNIADDFIIGLRRAPTNEEVIAIQTLLAAVADRFDTITVLHRCDSNCHQLLNPFCRGSTTIDQSSTNQCPFFYWIYE